MKNPSVFPWHQLVADIYENIEPSEGIKQEAKLLLRQSEAKYKLDDVIAELRLRAQLLLAEALARDVIEGLIVILDSSGLPIKIKDGHSIPTGAACPMITINAGNSWLEWPALNVDPMSLRVLVYLDFIEDSIFA